MADLRATLAKLTARCEHGRRLARHVGKGARDAAEFNATAGTLRNFIAAQQGLGEGANDRLRDCPSADAVQRSPTSSSASERPAHRQETGALS